MGEKFHIGLMMVDGDNDEIEGELAEARLELLRVRADADALARKLRSVMLQSEIKTAVVRRNMALTAQAQRDVAQAQKDVRQARRDVEAVLKSNSWRLTSPFRHVSKKLMYLLRPVEHWRRRSKPGAGSPVSAIKQETDS